MVKVKKKNKATINGSELPTCFYLSKVSIGKLQFKSHLIG